MALPKTRAGLKIDDGDSDPPRCPIHYRDMKFVPSRLVFVCPGKDGQDCDLVAVMPTDGNPPTAPLVLHVDKVSILQDNDDEIFFGALDTNIRFRLPDGVHVVVSGESMGGATVRLSFPAGTFSHATVERGGFSVEEY